MSATFSEALGRPVVAADTAETLGDVRSFVVDPTASHVEAIHVSGGGSRGRTIPWHAITSFGQDAVIAGTAHDTDLVTTDHDVEAVKGDGAAIGARVLTTTGFELGKAMDVTFDVDTGELTGVQTQDERIEGDRLRSLGSYALIVDAAAG